MLTAGTMTATALVACPQCARHVRVAEALCPFCASDLERARNKFRERARPTQRLSRAALYAFGVGVAAACGGSVGAGIETMGPDPDAGEVEGGQLKGGVDCINGPDYTGCACNDGEQKVCYTGPASTLGVAPCAPGVQRCLPAQEAQYAYGPCEGETVPTDTARCGLAMVDGGMSVDAATDEDVMGQAAYGGFPVDASTEPDATFLPPYGHVPFDATPGDAGVDSGDSDATVLAAYGGPPGG